MNPTLHVSTVEGPGEGYFKDYTAKLKLVTLNRGSNTERIY